MPLLSLPRELKNVRGRRILAAADPDEMVMDARTYRDLEVFEADGGALTLFDLCNRTRTEGGARLLRARMKKPFASASKIRRVQDAVRFTLLHRKAFNPLPGQGIAAGIERYFHSGLPLLTTERQLEFLLEALEVRFGDLRSYWGIVAGLQQTTAMLRALRRMMREPELSEAPGELAPWLEEIRRLIARPAFDLLPEEGHGELSPWRVMRIDRVFRSDERETIERLLHLVFQLDAVLAMADTVRVEGFTIPVLQESPFEVAADGVFHPFLDAPVPNPVHIDQTERLLFLTGPNMAGKTTYLRAFATSLYLAHLGMGVPAKSFRFAPCTNFFSAITVTDSVREGVSFFRAEALRMKAIADAIARGRRVIALIDEPFKGTNVKDALDASRAVLLRLTEKEDCLFIVTSHLIELGDDMKATGRVRCCRFEANEHEGRLEFDYVMRAGVSAQRLGVRVLREEGVFDLLDRGR